MTRRRRVLLAAFATVLVGYALVVYAASSFQDRLAFPGARGSLRNPTESGFPAGEIVFLDTPDSQRVAGWYLPPDPAPESGLAPALLWFHGNRETVAGISGFIGRVRPPGVAVLAIDYRGYGISSGSPTENNVYADAKLAWDYLARRPGVDSTRIMLYGRSIGSAVALELARHRASIGVILDSPFSSARDMGKRHYPFLPSSMSTLRLDNVRNAGRLQAPLLVFHGENDYIAPLEMGRAVANAGGGELLVFPGSGHNDMYTADLNRYRRAFHEFVQELLPEN